MSGEASSASLARRLAATIDHTLLSPRATPAAIRRLCVEARRLGFRAVCVVPWHVGRAAAALAGCEVGVAAVVGFPLGANLVADKTGELRSALRAGASEFDVVVSLPALMARDYGYLQAELEALSEAFPASAQKWIVEVGLLDRARLDRVCALANRLGPGHLKTATGMLHGPTTPEMVSELRRRLRPGIGVKAAGGIRTLEQLRLLYAAGADLIGSSSGPAMLAQLSAGGA